MPVTAENADRIQAGLRAAAADLAALTAAHTEAARIIAAAAAPPVRSGRLRASIRAAAGPDGATVTADTRYARYIERRTGFMSKAVEATRTQRHGAYVAEVRRVCERI